MAAIIGYRSNVDIDVSFDDGYKMENVRLASWKNGCLCHPDYQPGAGMEVLILNSH